MLFDRFEFACLYWFSGLAAAFFMVLFRLLTLCLVKLCFFLVPLSKCQSVSLNILLALPDLLS